MMPITVSRTAVAGAAALALLVGLGAASVFRARGQASPQPTASAEMSSSQSTDLLLAQRTKGDSAAPITIYEVSDFQCSFCRQFWEETLPALDREYLRTGKARLVFLNFPLVQIHPNAVAAHELAMCAAEQDRFWSVHDLLYQHQARWAPLGDPSSFFLSLADSAGLEPARLGACLSSGKGRLLVQAEYEAAAGAGLRSTPSFIIQGALLAGAASISEWRPILDSIYAARGGR